VIADQDSLDSSVPEGCSEESEPEAPSSSEVREPTYSWFSLTQVLDDRSVVVAVRLVEHDVLQGESP
jgi:hypothetical protein